MTSNELYGLMAEFTQAKDVLEATRRVRSEGYRDVEVYTPFPVEGLSESIGFSRNRVAVVVFCGGLIGGIGGYFMQWFSAVKDYPFNIGGRPLHSWPAFLIPTFEMVVLGAALCAFFGMLILNGLPKLHHPVFNTPRFDLAMRNGFFLCIKTSDPHFDRENTARLLDDLGPARVSEIPMD